MAQLMLPPYGRLPLRVALQYILDSPQFKLGPGPENLVHLLYPKWSIMSVDKEEDHKRIRAALGVGFTAAVLTVFPATLGYSVDDLGEEFISNNIEILTLASDQLATHILGEAIGLQLPTFVIRRVKYLADELGIRVVQGKRSGARQGLEIDTDLLGQLLQQQHDSTSAKHSMTEKEIVAQTGMMILAGQETTSTTLSFGLIELAKAPELQEKLRAEINATVGSARASSVAYNSIPLLNAFIKSRWLRLSAMAEQEVLRMYPAEAIGKRMIIEDAVIPLADGNISHLPVARARLLESCWGKDAYEFRPSRWLDGGVFKGEAVSPYANLLSFLGGPQTCLGILEMQVFLSELVASIPPARHTKHFRTVAADERERWDDRQERGGMISETRQDNGRGRRDNGQGRQDDGWDEAGWGQGGHRQLAYSSRSYAGLRTMTGAQKHVGNKAGRADKRQSPLPIFYRPSFARTSTKESTELGRRSDTPSVDAGASTSSHWAAKISVVSQLNW
ncbi:cytochrome P450 [Mycena albidolilacea]|uniref:Cytochrome P450 n=1 Tax=Mycena albidolilacea TaxID=1033008 RepID=A0AAD7EXV4_9AGAR|nr:cytochrome P450 [Mycena albidolilacea]